MKIRSIGILAGALFTLLIGSLGVILIQQNLNKPTPFRFNTQPTPTNKPKAIQVKQSFQGKIDEAEELIKNQYYSKATLLLSEALAQKPNLIRTYKLLGQIYTETQDIDKLENLIEIMSQRFPEDESVALLETQKLIIQEEFKTILDSFEAQPETLTPELSFYRGTLLALQNNHERAKEIYEEILSYKTQEPEDNKQTPPSPQENSPESSKEEIKKNGEKEITISPSLEKKTQDLLETYSDFDLVNDGENPHLFALFSKSLAQNRELHLAKAFAEEALKEDVKYIDAWVLRGYASLLLGNTQSALKDLEYAYEQAPERTNTHYFLGLAYSEVGRTKEATQFFEKVLETDFEYEENLKEKLIELYIEEKEYEKVIGLYGELLLDNKNPKDHIPPLQMAIEVINKPDIALEFTKKLIKQNPRDYLSYNFHAWALIANKRFTEAKESLDTALELKPNNPGSYLYLGLLYEEQNKISQALKAYKKSYEVGAKGSEIGITRLAAEKHNQLLKQKEQPEEKAAPSRSPNSP